MLVALVEQTSSYGAGGGGGVNGAGGTNINLSRRQRRLEHFQRIRGWWRWGWSSRHALLAAALAALSLLAMGMDILAARAALESSIITRFWTMFCRLAPPEARARWRWRWQPRLCQRRLSKGR